MVRHAVCNTAGSYPVGVRFPPAPPPREGCCGLHHTEPGEAVGGTRSMEEQPALNRSIGVRFPGAPPVRPPPEVRLGASAATTVPGWSNGKGARL